MDRTQAARLLIVAGSAVWLVTSLAVSAGWLDAPDLAIDHWVLEHIGPPTRAFWGGWGSAPGASLAAGAAVAVAAVVCLLNRAVATAILLVLAATLGGVLVTEFKALYRRPYPAHHGANPSPAAGTGFPFANGTRGPDDSNATNVPPTFPTRPGMAYPSGHTMGAASWAMAILLGARAARRARSHGRWAIGAAVAVLLVVGVARVVVRAHWASDVVGSWGLGAALLGLALLADDAWAARRDGTAL